MELPSVAELKSQAKRLRKALNENGKSLSHSEALELLSAQYGYRDWNTARASAARINQLSLSVGMRVTGTYMKQAFEGEITSLSFAGSKERYYVTIQFDSPVDVVSFDSFSAFRSRVNCLIGADGVALKRTSDGEPYLKMRPAH
ncbi:glyoxalase superfamily protein [uncultured Roseibium sp.]|uniref:glyoxalase superfamily protein n=1 Tax=uncultured Roseibium sp. TaxID=1936171 RepID=UPI0026028C43|nr:glyoxalase superfamily protein [uncultured Roseibium sp.]